MNSKTVSFIILLIIASLPCYAQYFPFKKADTTMVVGLIEDIKTVKWRNSILLRKSAPNYFADKNSKIAKKGALIAFTFPKDKQDSYAINAGLIFGFNKVVENNENVLFIKSAYLPYVQFDKNTLIDKEQSNMLLGISYTHNTVNYFSNEDMAKFNLIYKANMSYRNDFENDFEALQTSFIVSLQKVEIDKKGILKRANWFSKNSVFDIDLNLGLEYDYRFNSDTAFLDGNMFRTYSKAITQLKLSDDLATTLDWEYRYVLSNSTDLDENDFSLLTFKVNYKFKNSIGGRSFKNNLESIISIIHQNGTNPTNGFNDQSYWALALELKI